MIGGVSIPNIPPLSPSRPLSCLPDRDFFLLHRLPPPFNPMTQNLQLSALPPNITRLPA